MAASRSWLMSMPEGLEDDEDSSEFNADIELMTGAYSFARAGRCELDSGDLDLRAHYNIGRLGGGF
jgi:hypothetical protein